jgi:hypothetical protein
MTDTPRERDREPAMNSTAMNPTASHATASTPAMIPIRAFRTPVRGYAFAAPPPGGERPAPGLPAELAREPDNPADPLAVAVWASPTDGARWRIGYLDRGVAARVAPRLDAGSRVRAQFDGWSAEPEGRWRRPLLLLLPDDEDAVAMPEPAAPSSVEASATSEPSEPSEQPEPAESSASSEPSEQQEPAESSASSEPSEQPEPDLELEPATSEHSHGEALAAPAGPDAPRIWGRPPGMRRRRVS